jgi:hypothetical protein
VRCGMWGKGREGGWIALPRSAERERERVC